MMKSLKGTYFDLIDLIEEQNQINKRKSKVIQQQSETILKLLNDNAEKENMINELMKGLTV